MSTFTLTHDLRSAPRLTLHGIWSTLRGRFPAVQAGAAPLAAGPLGQSEAAIYARGMLGWRG